MAFLKRKRSPGVDDIMGLPTVLLPYTLPPTLSGYSHHTTGTSGSVGIMEQAARADTPETRLMSYIKELELRIKTFEDQMEEVWEVIRELD